MGEKKEKGNGGDTIVLKADFHCEGCATKVMKCIRSFDGVKGATIDGQKITVAGKVDPAKLRQKIEQKTHQKVELISPQPKKDSGGSEKEKKKDNNGKKSDDQKASNEKEPPTAVLKLNLHCDGCIHKIYKTVTKSKGYKDVKIDTQKELVTVSGAIDVKALADELQKQLKRDVAIVPPKKEGDKKEKGGGDGKGKSGGGENGQGKEMQGPSPVNPHQHQHPYPHPYPFPHQQPYPYPYPHQQPYPIVSGPGHAAVDQFQYNPYGAQFHAPQIFSDENPNACSVM
ncbi:heavy metal-associated isoprenylated plant protein 3-like [Salvia divinorum]|uniref:Heavy metal-associated isoprenylated plant protein 3-like n=1 Tax=Salvia divinorum TaxID=28513 RepID=A0ABD1HNY1_SALDI